MKTLFLLRHAKSSWDEPSVPDILRPLSSRGKRAAPRMGAYMASQGHSPVRVLCSPARRAMDTWTLVEEQLKSGSVVEIKRELYGAAPRTILALIRKLPDDEDTALLVGHNPGFEDLALALAASGEGTSLDTLDRKYPTGALCVFEFQVESWDHIREGTGHLRAFVMPRRLS